MEAVKIKIVVVDNKGGYPVSGQKVKEYGKDAKTTDEKGCVTLLLEDTRTTIYVNGFEAYDGFVSNLDEKEIFTTIGGRPD
jgi:hypothetical protein